MSSAVLFFDGSEKDGALSTFFRRLFSWTDLSMPFGFIEGEDPAAEHNGNRHVHRLLSPAYDGMLLHGRGGDSGLADALCCRPCPVLMPRYLRDRRDIAL